MYHEGKATNYNIVTYEVAMSYQDGTAPHQGDEFINMSDIGKYMCWDEAGLFNGLADSEQHAKVKTMMYWWSWLNGADPRLHELPRFTNHEQCMLVHEKYPRMQVICLNVEKPIYLERTETGWRPMNHDECVQYTAKHHQIMDALMNK